ncbi:universal stress protein [Cognatishimia sp. WU-CL00825]|uniref:universal stress protein n=1 Tax=Cognatishimia sp. WU-CL00825 TaxID=3127658 RepID=UPI003108FEBE
MYKNILVPIAPDHGTPSGPALDIARRLAADDARITALTVLDVIPEYASIQLPKEIHDSRKAEAREILAGDLGGVKDIKPMVITGHSYRGILDYAEETGVDCIVISSHRPELADYLLGSTAARVVRHANCCVHVIR